MLKPRPRKRLHCWIRQQRIILAAHKYIYYKLCDSVYEDLQFDYLEKRLEVVEKRYPEVALSVESEGYLSPSSYVDSLDHPNVAHRAERILDKWERRGRPRVESVPIMTNSVTCRELYWDALRSIVRYPI